MVNVQTKDLAARLKQTNLVRKIDFENKLISFKRKINSNKTKYLEVQKKLNSLTIKDHNFFVGRTYFRSNDRPQNTYVYQLTLDTLEFKKKQGY